MRTQAGTAGALLLVNAAHPMPDSPPPDLVCVDSRWPKVQLERRAARLLTACIRAAGGERSIVPVSGWRCREEQQAIWDDTLAREGERFTRQYVALPGCSEHQTGLAIDLGLAAEEIDFIRPHFPYDGVCGVFRQLAADYGFVLRYPPGKEAITGISHEPWHFRYVGVPHAKFMAERGLVLEEYVALLRRRYTRRPLTIRTASHTFHVCRREAGDWDAPPQEPGTYRQVWADNCGGLVITRWR